MKALEREAWLNLSSFKQQADFLLLDNLTSGEGRRSLGLGGKELWSAGIDFAGCSCSTSMLLGGVSYSDTTREYSAIMVPGSVKAEVIDKGMEKGKPDAFLINSIDWINAGEHHFLTDLKE